MFTPAERKRIESFPEPDVLLWALWAGKEAAFKVLAKKNPALPFIPRNYEVHLDDYGLRGTSTDAGTCNPHVEGAVLTPEGTIPLRVYRRCTYIHALALSEGEEYFDYVFWRVEVLPELKGVDSLEVESRIVREAPSAVSPRTWAGTGRRWRSAGPSRAAGPARPACTTRGSAPRWI